VKKPRAKSFEDWYPTQAARHVADRVFDGLPLSTPIGECPREGRERAGHRSAGTQARPRRRRLGATLCHCNEGRIRTRLCNLAL